MITVATESRVAELEQMMRDLQETNAVLMERVESSVDHSGSALSLFEQNIVLQQIIRERTKEVVESNHRLRLEIVERIQAGREYLLFKAAVEQAAEGIVIFDSKGRIEYANPSFLQMTGFAAEDVVGRISSDFGGEELADDSLHTKWDSLRAGNVWKGIIQRRCKDGTHINEEETVSPVRDENGEIINYVAVARDVTKEQLLEAQLRQAQKLESIGQLAAGIAHEINTPAQYVGDNTRFMQESLADLLGLIRLYKALADSKRDDPDYQAGIKQIDECEKSIDLEYLMDQIPLSIEQALEGIGRITRIVRAMKEFSHPGSATLTPTNLNAAIENTITVARSEWKYVAELSTDFDSKLPPVPCLPADFNQVILNLIVNAAHSIADKEGGNPTEKGCIHVTTRVVDNWAEIRIRDEGMGIPESIRGRIFDPFFTTKEVGRGTGQGLTIAHNVIVEKHHGTITFETELGVGTTFIIRLPLDQPTSS